MNPPRDEERAPAAGSGEPAAGPGTAAPGRKLLQILAGSWLAQGCCVVAALGIADLLADGPKTAAELASTVGADPHALHRLLRALASAGLFEQTGSATFGLTPLTSPLRSDAPQSVRQTAIMLGEEVFKAFGELRHAVQTGRPAFDAVYGMPMYEYLSASPAASKVFNAALGSRRGVPAALERCQLGDARTVVDVGGGNGSLLAGVLAPRPGVHGVLLELADAISGARERLAEAGLLGRVTLVEGSFFDEVPAGGDFYILSRCLHNWGDESALRILRAVRAAMKPGSRLAVVERIIPAGPGRSEAKIYDLLMLAMVEGRNRTEQEYRDLVTAAGFEVAAVHAEPEDSPAESAIEAVAA